MKLFATSILALLGLATVTSALDDLDDKACNEGEKQCILKGQMIDQCINGKWAIVKVCKPGDVCVENPTALCVLKPVQKGTTNAERDVSAMADLGNDVAESSATDDCRDGDAQCEVLPLILLGRHAIKRCNDDHKWFTAEVCNPEDVCNAKPYPQCVGVKAVEAREEDGDEDSIDTANKAEMPCSKCKKFREQCNTDCCKRTHCRTQTVCRKECINQMEIFLVEDGQNGRYRGSCKYYCPQLL
ncbi:uncharacterized protein ALTATR162_LOCUS910 [Alternaria atra]|uniref:Uncharacterized protein n=1 Tax=Alternaria atra TaxID=119953 RepID=A0A8J2N0X7_9PLEO|nr:uncharacterized protein ALTATR162_LOCUS910 [Alternaria atra]CAG5141311.1 unnamed protein product [Alternaria atra]